MKITAIVVACAVGTSAFCQNEEKDLYLFGWYLYRCSSANAINGLNLSREQVQTLRDLAKEVQAASIDYKHDAKPSDEVADAIKTFHELEQTLIAGKEVSAELEARVAKARAKESDWLKKGLRKFVDEEVKSGNCSRCHGGGGASGKTRVLSFDAKEEQGRAHIVALLGKEGVGKVALLAKKVDALLTETQQSALSGFTCCLVPPKTGSVRVGQAAVADWKIDLLRRVKDVPDGMWGKAKEKVLDLLEKAEGVKNPGYTDAQKADMRKRVGAMLEKARGLSDEDLEMNKEELCKEIGISNPPIENEGLANFQTAFFLLQPCTVEIYDAYIKRLDKPATDVQKKDRAAEKPC